MFLIKYKNIAQQKFVNNIRAWWRNTKYVKYFVNSIYFGYRGGWGKLGTGVSWAPPINHMKVSFYCNDFSSGEWY